MNCYALLRSRGSDRQRSYAPVILLLPNLKSGHRLTDAWPADCAYLLSAVEPHSILANATVRTIRWI